MGPLGNLAGLAVMLALPVYLVVQIIVLLRWRGWPFRLALIPLAVMGLAFAAFLNGTRAGSNLAPIFMVLAAPPCLIWLWIVSLFRR
jgi:hypothetical protein